MSATNTGRHTLVSWQIPTFGGTRWLLSWTRDRIGKVHANANTACYRRPEISGVKIWFSTTDDLALKKPEKTRKWTQSRGSSSEPKIVLRMEHFNFSGNKSGGSGCVVSKVICQTHICYKRTVVSDCEPTPRNKTFVCGSCPRNICTMENKTVTQSS